MHRMNTNTLNTLLNNTTPDNTHSKINCYEFRFPCWFMLSEVACSFITELERNL